MAEEKNTKHESEPVPQQESRKTGKTGETGKTGGHTIPVQMF